LYSPGTAFITYIVRYCLDNFKCCAVWIHCRHSVWFSKRQLKGQYQLKMYPQELLTS